MAVVLPICNYKLPMYHGMIALFGLVIVALLSACTSGGHEEGGQQASPVDCAKLQSIASRFNGLEATAQEEDIETHNAFHNLPSPVGLEVTNSRTLNPTDGNYATIKISTDRCVIIVVAKSARSEANIRNE